MPTKQTGGNVMLYGPILMESLAPDNKGLPSPGPGDWNPWEPFEFGAQALTNAIDGGLRPRLEQSR